MGKELTADKNLGQVLGLSRFKTGSICGEIFLQRELGKKMMGKK